MPPVHLERFCRHGAHGAFPWREYVRVFHAQPRGGSAKAIDAADAAALRELMVEHDFGPLVAHAPYTLNPCSAKPEAREFARMCMADDLVRMEAVPHSYYNFHPGSHVKQGAEYGIELIAGLLNEVLAPEQTTTVLLETMAGKGTEVGRHVRGACGDYRAR